MSTYNETLFRAIAKADTAEGFTTEELEWFDSVLAGRESIPGLSKRAARSIAAYKGLTHHEYWDRVYGSAPEGPTDWEVEDYAEENGYTDMEEARRAMSR